MGGDLPLGIWQGTGIQCRRAVSVFSGAITECLRLGRSSIKNRCYLVEGSGTWEVHEHGTGTW